MHNWDDTDRQNEYDKWANWTINPPRSSDTLIKCISAFVFMLTAGTQFVGIIA